MWRTILLALCACLLALPAISLAQPEQGCDVNCGLEWCSRDHGFNEGATCGLNALGGTSVGGLPGMATQAILGNTWDRTNMMGATKAAARAGQHEAAIDAAICCQIHNGPYHAYLEANRAAVLAWLLGH
jgi:hypothetical protein